jgi:hypothetical protein
MYSDINDEMRVPLSKLVEHHFDKMPFPNMSLLGVEPRIADSYILQLQLRDQFNAVRLILRDTTKSCKAMAIEKYLRYDFMPRSLALNDGDQPARDIIGARLRAFYWKIKVITYRPCIDRILNEHGKSHAGKAISYAKRAIAALVESNRAFHGLGEKRPIVTSSCSTARA